MSNSKLTTHQAITIAKAMWNIPTPWGGTRGPWRGAAGSLEAHAVKCARVAVKTYQALTSTTQKKAKQKRQIPR